MRRTLALFAATLVLGVQALLAALPVRGGTTPTPGCGGGMACCDVMSACSPGDVQACHGAAAEPATDVPCMKALGCGHSTPGVAVPTLEPLVLQRHASLGAAPGETAATAVSHDLPLAFASEPSPPPPRA